MIRSMEPEICTKMLKNLSEKLKAKFPATMLIYSLERIARLDDTFSGIFKLQATPVNHCENLSPRSSSLTLETKVCLFSALYGITSFTLASFYISCYVAIA